MFLIISEIYLFLFRTHVILDKGFLSGKDTNIICSSKFIKKIIGIGIRVKLK